MLARRDFASCSSPSIQGEDEEEDDDDVSQYRMKRVLSDGDDVARRAKRPEFESHPAIERKVDSTREDHTKRYLYELSRSVFSTVQIQVVKKRKDSVSFSYSKSC